MNPTAYATIHQIQDAMAAALNSAGFAGVEVTMRSAGEWTVDGEDKAARGAAAFLAKFHLMAVDAFQPDAELGLTFCYLHEI